MATRTTELAMRVVADVSDGVSGLEKIESASAGAAAAVDRVGTATDGVGSKLDGIGASAENLDDKAGRATGALGALSSGFELVGAEKYAGALQAAALATDFASGAGQALNLVLELESVKRVKAVVQAKAHAVATMASTTATKTATVAQRALNLALNANPIGLVVTALALLAAGVVLAYNKSETFRNVVDKAFGAAQKSVQPVVNVIGDIATKVGDAIGWVRDKFPPAVETAKTKVVAGFEAMLSPVTTIYDAVVNLIEKIKDIKLPDVDLTPWNRAALTAPPAVPGGMVPNPFGGGSSAAGGDVSAVLRQILDAIKGTRVEVTALDVQAMVRLLRRHGYVVGTAPGRAGAR